MHNGAGDVGCAIQILPTRITQKQLALADGTITRLRHTVMHNGAMRPAAGNGRKARPAIMLLFSTKFFQRIRCLHLAHLAACKRIIEPV